ncbi:MAG: hypothetical protein CMN33_01670, partial [Saprospirales bacterium]|nr:hypothetical protein [Saprospirales bacterium]
MATITAYKAEKGINKLVNFYTEMTSDTCLIFNDTILSGTFSLKSVRSYREEFALKLPLSK